MSLEHIQRNFLRYLQQDSNTIEQSVISTEKVNAKQRLQIYGYAYAARLIEALEDNFPALHTLLGDEAFYDLANRYLRHHPSRHFSLRYFGHQLATWMSEQPDYTTQPVLEEMARFEWIIWKAFDAANQAPLELSDLQTIPPEHWQTMSFDLHPSVNWLDLSWNTPHLWQAINNEEDPIAPEQQEHPINWLVWRQELGTYFRALEVDEAWALIHIKEKANFGEICEGICEWIEPEHAPARVVGFLSQWLQDGLIGGIHSQ